MVSITGWISAIALNAGVSSELIEVPDARPWIARRS
jgi:hypothetical protein